MARLLLSTSTLTSGVIETRMYSAVVAEECDVLALSWEDLLAVERKQRAAEVF